MNGVEAEAQRVIRDWLLLVREKTGWSLSKIATEAGVARSTVANAVNDPNYSSVMSMATITRISRAANVPPPPLLTDPRTGFGEPEATPYAVGLSPLDTMISAFIGGRSSLVPWELKTSALTLAGYMPGDIVILDMNGTPANGDVVCAQVYDFDASEAKTIWRRYQAPYLIAASAGPEFQLPVRADDRSAAIKGVVVISFRPRKAA
jgi:transcriptional regulator with XRE-family HTH domain